MARQDINIGVEGNDGTGDSIRESFRKVNENFSEIYAIFGAGGSISFTALSDTPETLVPNTIPLINDAGSEIQLVELASNSALDSQAQDTITFSYSQAGKLVISTAFTKLADDQRPTLGAPFNAGGNAIGNVNISVAAAEQLNTVHGTNITIDDLVITKGYADRRYVSSGLPIRVADEPVTKDIYKLEINRYISGNIEVLDHGYDTGINGTAFVFNAVYTDPNDLSSEEAALSIQEDLSYKIISVGSTDFTAIGADYNKVGEVFKASLTDDNGDPITITGNGRVKPVYFLRYVSSDRLGVFSLQEDAIIVDDTEADASSGKIYIGATSIASDDTHTFTDAGVDDTLEGNFLGDVAMPRKNIVRRQGDTMEGALFLNDHPGDIAGFGTPNGSDDLQAATKFYVDSSAYASTVNLYVSTDGDDRMIGVPVGKEGSSLQYAYRTINAAAQRAEEIIRTSAPEPGPYFQTVTRDNGNDFAEVISADIIPPGGGNAYELTRSVFETNRDYLIKEISGYIKYTYPDFVYNIELCERDTGLIVDAIAYDINRGLTANSLTRTAAERYYSSTSARYAITQQLTETVDAVDTLRNIADALQQNKLYREKTIDSIALSGTNNERARVTTTTNHGFENGEQVIFLTDETAIRGISAGMVEINRQTAYIKVITDQVFELYTDPDLLELWDISTGYTAYTAGGKVGIVYQPRVDAYDGVKEQQVLIPGIGDPEDPLWADPDSAARAAIGGAGGKFDLIINIMENGPDAGGDVVYGRNYKVVLNNGGQSYVDQANPNNTDTLPGKIMVGKISGAEGRIVKVTTNDGTEANQDSFELIQLNGKDFQVGEPIEYGNFVKQKQVGILVETGIYEEDYPIKLGSNVSLVGDEFRRVIIRPKKRVSQSKWANMYFFRDKEFDGITLATQGAPFYNQNGELQGYFGRHYLADPEKELNVGVPVINTGNYKTAAEILRLNKDFIQNEVIHYIDNNFQDLLYNKTICRRDLGLMLDAIRYDVAIGTNYNQVTAGLAYQRANNAYNLNFEQTNTLLAIADAKTDVAALLSDGTAITRANDGFDEIVDIIENNTPDALSFPVPGTLPTTDADDAATRLQNNRTFIQKEIIAWIADNHPFFDYSVSPCERDVGYIVDGLTYDILYGGNSATQTVAKSYFDGIQSNLGVGEKEVTLEAYARLKTVVDQVVRGVAVTTSPDNTETQDTTGADAGTTEGNQLQVLIEDNIIRAINTNGVAGLDPTSYPNLAWVTAAIRTDSDAINSSKPTIIDDVIDYLDNNITFLYDQDKCSRDVGLILDALILDLRKGGQEFVLETQGEYFDNYISQYNDNGFGGQATITIAAMNHIVTLAGDLLVGTAPSANTSVIADISQGSGESGTVSLVGNLVDVVTFAFDPAYNPPKRNDANGVDVFLMGDAARVQNATVQGHGGFMVVLDPEEQILTKSPYIQVGSSFSRSSNAKRFRGGMYVDAYVGNIPAYIPQTIDTGDGLGPRNGKVNNFELWIQSDTGQGLFVRPPQLPCPFYVDGRRYQVNAISDYDSGNGWCKIYLDPKSNAGTGYDETQFADGLYYRNVFLQTAGNRSMLGNDFTQINDLGYGLVCNNGALSEMVSMFTYYCQAAYYSKNGSEIRSTNGSNGYGNFGLVAEGADPNEIPDQVTLKNNMCIPAVAYTSVQTTNSLDDTSLYVTDMETPPTINSLITIDHGGSIGVLDYVVSQVQNVSDTDNDGVNGNSVDDITSGAGRVYNNIVYKLDLRADDTYANNFYGSLRDNVADGTYVEYRHNFTHIFEGVNNPADLDTRPSTAINFDESDDKTYRSLSFSQADSFSQPLASDEILVSIEVGYEFIDLEVDTGNLGGGYGSAQGDTKIAVKATSLPIPAKVERLLRDVAGLQPGDAGYAGGMFFTWQGRTHQIVDYDDSGAFAFITISDTGADVSGFGGTGISTGLNPSDRILHCGIGPGATAEITLAISLCRATGHDFTQIGSGGYNDSNYPNVLFGQPVAGDISDVDFWTDGTTATSAQVWERRKGRVFWMSTDQNGFFRVGKFFSVDQGTGDIEFSGEIGLTGANSLGFKRGVTINEFSADDSFSDFSGTAVPTERATGNFINRVLGWNVQSGSQIGSGSNRIGPGFLPLNGVSAMEGDIDMGSNNITNLALPGSDGTAAANKNYVDGKVAAYDQIEDLRNVEFNNVAVNDILVATGKKRVVITPITGGSWSIGDLFGLSNSSKTGTIVDLESVVDPIEGNVVYVTYDVTPGHDDFDAGEILYDLPGQSATATVIDDSVDEIANAAEHVNSVINWSVARDANGATIDLQIQNDTIINADVKSNAGISQSKLAMQKANTFDEDNATSGWSGTAGKVQADLGLAKFSDENFDTLEGYVRIKANGIVFAELNDIDQYTLFGRQTSGNGDPEEVAYSDAVKYGSGLEDRDFENAEWTETTVTKLVFASPVTVADGNTLSQGAVTGDVQGDVYLETTVYVSNVSGGNFNTSADVQNDDAVPVENLGTPVTASAQNLFGRALIKIEDGSYATTTISTGTTADTIARRNPQGKLNASVLQIDGYDIIDNTGTTIQLKTPGGATILESTGAVSNTLQTKVLGSLNVGQVTNNVGGTAFTQSNAQASNTSNNKGFVATNWMYTNFIEALSESDEQGTATTGISFSDGTAYDGNGADTILFITNGTPRLAVKGNSVETTIQTLVKGADFKVQTAGGTDKFTVDDATGDTNVKGDLTVEGNINLGVSSSGVSFVGSVASDILPDANNTRNIGSSTLRWNTVYAGVLNGVATEAKYADLAENYVADAEYEPGTVLVFGGEQEVTTTDSKADHRVAGVVSTNPAHLMNAELDAVNTVALALTGRVPCKVIGTVKKGDLLVTSAIPGYAIVWNNPGRVGTVIGKALENKETSDRGVIEIVVGRV